MRSLRHVRGLSLLEIMIALLIGSLLILGLVQVFAASRTAYQMAEGMSRVQENARFAMDYLQRDLRMAGHFGCVNDQSHLQVPGALQSHLVGGTDTPLNFRVSVQGYEAPNTAPGQSVPVRGGTLPPLPPSLTGLGAVPGSDVLVLRYLHHQGVPVIGIDSSGLTEVLKLANGRWTALTSEGRTNPGIFGIADCSYVDIFAATSPGGAGEVEVTLASTGTNLGGRYTPQPSGQTMLYRAESVVYYVAENPGGNRALYRAFHDGAAYTSEELVEGVESLQLLFGLDRETDLANNPPSGYIDTYAVADTGWSADTWRGVGVVQVGLLMGSPSRAASEQAAQRPVLGVSFTPPAVNDGIYRSGYETTVALRNRLYGN